MRKSQELPRLISVHKVPLMNGGNQSTHEEGPSGKKTSTHGNFFSYPFQKGLAVIYQKKRKMSRNFWNGWILVQIQGTQKVTLVHWSEQDF